uniref:Matrix remodeling associated 5 n=1 Tax=Pavo cristatus TaxID=9049 RepID=A0A8C9LAL5_PAVCR
MQSDDSGSRTKRYVVFNNGTLYFNDVGLREEGDYTCYAENQIGKDEMKVRVKVVAEPATIRNKTYVIINVPYGDVVTVACEAKGEPTPKVTWLSPTNRPIPTLSEKYQVYRDGTLLIQKAQRSDSGNYTCVVRNSAGEDRKVVWIHVNVQPPRINGHLNAITSASGTPSPHISWIFPDRKILQTVTTTESRIMLHENRTLSIKQATFSDRGVYKCVASNAAGADSISVRLHIAALPPIIQQDKQENISLPLGSSVNIHCTAKAAPSPSIRWFVNGNLFVFPNGTLYIRNVSPKDSGIYECIAANMVGARSTVTLEMVRVMPPTLG